VQHQTANSTNTSNTKDQAKEVPRVKAALCEENSNLVASKLSSGKASVDDKLATDTTMRTCDICVDSSTRVDEEAVSDTTTLYQCAQACVCTVERAPSSQKACAWEECENVWAVALGAAQGVTSKIYEDAQLAINKVDIAPSREKAQRWKQCEVAWAKALNFESGHGCAPAEKKLNANENHGKPSDNAAAASFLSHLTVDNKMLVLYQKTHKANAAVESSLPVRRASA